MTRHSQTWLRKPKTPFQEEARQQVAACIASMDPVDLEKFRSSAYRYAPADARAEKSNQNAGFETGEHKVVGNVIFYDDKYNLVQIGLSEYKSILGTFIVNNEQDRLALIKAQIDRRLISVIYAATDESDWLKGIFIGMETHFL